MLKYFSRPLQSLGLRIALIVIALGLFTCGGLYTAAWLIEPPGSRGGMSAISLMIAGGLLLFKARNPGNQS